MQLAVVRLGYVGIADIGTVAGQRPNQEAAYLKVYRRVLDGSRALAPAGG
jgi:hypothetical protein